MIEVLSSSSKPSPSSCAEEVATSALTAIVQHYSDPVHKVEVVLPDAERPAVPPVLQHWLDRVKNVSDNGDAIVSFLAKGYVEQIRPALFEGETSTLSRQGIPVLQHYEIFLSRVLENNQRRKRSKTDQENITTIHQETKNGFESDNQPFFSLEAMASDVSFLTKLASRLHEEEQEKYPQEISHSMVTGFVLPIMMRLVTDHLKILERMYTHRQDDDKSSLQSSLIKVAVALLAFGKSKLDPRDMIPYATKTMACLQEDETFLYIPILRPTHHAMAKDDEPRYLDLGLYNVTEESFWKELILDGSVWDRTESAALSKLVETCWLQLNITMGLLVSQSNSELKKTQKPAVLVTIDSNDGSNEEKSRVSHGNDNGIHSDHKTLQGLIKSCLSTLSRDDPETVAKAIRAHFFGRDQISASSDGKLQVSAYTRKTKRLHLGWEVEVEEEDPVNAMQRSFLDNPSRDYVAMQYILKVQRCDLLRARNPIDGTNAILEELLPILYELLSASASAHIAAGAVALIHLLSLTIHANETEESTNESLDKLSCDFEIFARYMGSLLPVLDLACQTCRKGAPFFFLARAQSLLCLLASTSQNNSLTKHRRKISRKFIFILDRNNHKVSDPDGLIWSLLMGGILPLLYQHGTLEETIHNVDGMELGRVGLAALLPILRYSSGYTIETDGSDSEDNVVNLYADGKASRKLLGPSVATLVHLLHVAYPIMPRHGGKIMSELLALLGNLQRQKLPKADLPLFEFVKDAAGMALIICGDRASEVLDMITTNDGKDFEPGLVEMVAVIRSRAEIWKESQQRIGEEQSLDVTRNDLTRSNPIERLE